MRNKDACPLNRRRKNVHSPSDQVKRYLRPMLLQAVLTNIAQGFAQE